MILEQVQQLLAGGQALTLSEIVERVPALHDRPEASEILRLLLRLDRRFVVIDDRWCTGQESAQDEARIVKAALAYFDAKAQRGELLPHLVAAISRATGEDRQRVQDVLLKTFQSAQGGRMVLNRRKG